MIRPIGRFTMLVSYKKHVIEAGMLTPHTKESCETQDVLHRIEGHRMRHMPQHMSLSATDKQRARCNPVDQAVCVFAMFSAGFVRILAVRQ